ncbi:MAG: glycosyltransferase family 2 protein [Syntrophomonas sp.]|nr:glycosyltransferase family 2 protein [Syntrophomonas sp.]
MTYDKKISVVMSVYNGELYLAEAIESILNQTFTNFEFIIINDGSTDSSRAIIESYIDPRIKLLNNDCNQGLAQSLNKGISTARGKYIARMDADDISLPARLEKQVAFMEENAEIGVCGTWVKIFGINPEWVRELETDPETMRCNFIFEHQIVHPSVIMRKDLLLKHQLFYNPVYKKAQDYELWCRCSRYLSVSNMTEVLLLYRERNDEQKTTHLMEQQYYANLIQLEELERLGMKPTAEEIVLHQEISVWRIPAEEIFAGISRRWFDKLLEANIRTHYYPEPAFTNNIEKRWLKICEISKVGI